MLDKRCFALLNYFTAECHNTGYKVFETEEILSKMPKEFGMDGEGLKECVYSLCERDYISVKYYDEKEVCLSPLPKGRLVFENRAEEELAEKKAVKRYFAYSFFGGAVGGALAVFLFAIIRALGGV